MEMIKNMNTNAKQSSNIFRYKLSDDTMILISKFSKLHQYDDRHAYKDAWALWLNENRDFVTREEMRLNNLGFNGDVVDKMFKAGRYYFREKKEGKKEVKEEAAKDAQFDEMADEPYNRPLFTSLEDLKNYLDQQYMADYNVELYRYIK